MATGQPIAELEFTRRKQQILAIMPLRFFVALTILLAALLVLFLVLVATETALTVWHYLRQAPLWVQVVYAVILAGLPILTVALFWNWLRPARKRRARQRTSAVSPDSLQSDLLASAESGVDVSAALAEMREQRARRRTGEIFIAICGEVSSGKSSLVNALLPEAKADADPRAGTTDVIRHYRWSAASGDRVVLADLPGFNLQDDTAALEEARRAHLVIFVCDGDLTASQSAQLHYLTGLGKPVVVAVNKTDRYSEDELEAVVNEIRRKSGLDRADVVGVSTGGREEVIRLLGDGIEERSERKRSPRVEALRVRVQAHLDDNRELMESLRETAVLMLASEKLEAARDRFRETKSDELVSRYSRRAVLGALAAVAPGSDLIIQGVLATRLIRELSALYDVPVKEMEIDSFLQLAGGKLKNMTAITLAIAGNALKAFPGLGTISGGLVHAVAYGMIFDSLGRAAAQTLASRGELRPYPAAEAFEDLLNEHLETGAVQFAKMAVSGKDKSAGAS
jgi:GTPase Era involved in 16S rRNA processing